MIQSGNHFVNRQVSDSAAARQYIPDMPLLRAMVDRIPEDSGLTCFGRVSPSPAALHRLDTEIRRILEDRHRVSLIMADPATKSGLSFRSTVPMCTQSTVKAIYVGALLNRMPEAYEAYAQEIRDTIVLSSNEAYERLRDVYGPEPIRAWCRETGVEEGFADLPYPRAYCARDMLKLWTRLYCFLNDGSDVHHVAGFYTNSAMSATRERLGDRYLLHTKAGWENGVGDDVTDYEHAVIPARFVDGNPLNDECATNDTGIVYTDRGPYLFVLYSDYPCPWSCPNRLYGLVDALHEARAD